MILYPEIDPVALALGPLKIRWYGIAYVTGILLGWWVCHQLIMKKKLHFSAKDFGDFIPWVTLGIVAGGRLGYVLFYNLAHYLDHPGDILQIWKPGMSFHGGLLGVVIVTTLFCLKRKLRIIDLMDVAAVGAPIGIFFGRIANFINAELVGRPTDAPWGMIFPGAGPIPRHPSQLYEAFSEGILLFSLQCLLVFMIPRDRRQPGLLGGTFLMGYALSRIVVEFFREPDQQIGYLFNVFTMGQLLTLPLFLCGIGMILYGKRCPIKSY